MQHCLNHILKNYFYKTVILLATAFLSIDRQCERLKIKIRL